MPTCFEIYETYQRGPAAALRLFEEALGPRAIYGPSPPDMQQRTIDSLSDEIGRLKRQVSRLKAALGEARGKSTGSAGVTRNWSSASRRTRITPRALPQRIRRGPSGRRACAGLRVSGREGRPGMPATHCG